MSIIFKVFHNYPPPPHHNDTPITFEGLRVVKYALALVVTLTLSTFWGWLRGKSKNENIPQFIVRTLMLMVIKRQNKWRDANRFAMIQSKIR